METLQILGWIYLGVMLGVLGGVFGLILLQSNKSRDDEQEIADLRLQRQLLKKEIFRLTKRGKPVPRKKRSWKKKPVKR